MPQRAFVPAPLIEAQPRVYKSFRGRQLRGLALAAVGAGLSLLVLGAQDFSGYAVTFLAALPGFAYGYYQTQGKPVEYWLRVWWRYYTGTQYIGARPQTWASQWRNWGANGRAALTAGWTVVRPKFTRRKGHRSRG